jgi:hypothetical protein
MIEDVRGDGRRDGSFDVEGHRWTDIHLFYRLNLLRPVDLFSYFQGVAAFVLMVVRIFFLCFDLKKKTFHSDIFLKAVATATPVLGLLRSFFGISLEDIAVFKEDEAEKDAGREMEPLRPDRNLGQDKALHPEDKYYIRSKSSAYRAWRDLVQARTNVILAGMTKEDLDRRLASKARAIGPGLYVSLEDITNILVDPAVVPYDLKDGYSDRLVIEIVGLWGRSILGLDVAARASLRDPHTPRSSIDSALRMAGIALSSRAERAGPDSVID